MNNNEDDFLTLHSQLTYFYLPTQTTPKKTNKMGSLDKLSGVTQSRGIPKVKLGRRIFILFPKLWFLHENSLGKISVNVKKQ